MTKFVNHKKSFTKLLNGRWEWQSAVWFSKDGMFADCIIKCPIGTQFNTQDEANENLLEVLQKLGIIKKHEKTSK